MYDFSGKVTLVTGGGGGIGEATARLFAECGSRVVVADRDVEAAERVAADIGELAAATRVDVVDPGSVSDMVSFTEKRFGALHVLVNNAGISSPKSPVENSDIANFERVFDINVKGVYLGVRSAVPLLRRSGGGSILNTASVAGLFPRPQSSIYAASKAAVITMTKALSIELAPAIRVNCVCPSTIDTGFMANVFPDERALANFRERLHANPGASMPLNILLETKDVALAYAFLASDHARGISGVALPIDGARSAGDIS
ncbi:SDR family oxidoreductase [Streptosporangium sp. NPDC004631]